MFNTESFDCFEQRSKVYNIDDPAELLSVKLNPINEAKVVSFPNRRSGNFIIMVGGSGSGKGYVINHYFDLDNPQIWNPDNVKEIYAKKHSINLKDPEQTAYVHKITEPQQDLTKYLFYWELGLDVKKYLSNKQESELNSIRLASGKVGLDIINSWPVPERKRKELPNVIIDITGKKGTRVDEHVQFAQALGYKNIVCVLALTPVELAISNNRKRARSVNEPIVRDIHYQVKTHFPEYIQEINFDQVWVVVNNQDYKEFVEREFLSLPLENGESPIGKGGKKIITRRGNYQRAHWKIFRIKPMDSAESYGYREEAANLLGYSMDLIPDTGETTGEFAARLIKKHR